MTELTQITDKNAPLITITQNAASKVKEMASKEGKTGQGLRLSVQAGGCEGFVYGLSFEDKKNENDQVIESNGVKVYVDPASAAEVKGSVIDFIETPEASGFSIKNPAKSGSCGGCGCGRNAC